MILLESPEGEVSSRIGDLLDRIMRLGHLSGKIEQPGRGNGAESATLILHLHEDGDTFRPCGSWEWRHVRQDVDCGISYAVCHIQ